jgi:hypothetical protein
MPGMRADASLNHRKIVLFTMYMRFREDSVNPRYPLISANYGSLDHCASAGPYKNLRYVDNFATNMPFFFRRTKVVATSSGDSKENFEREPKIEGIGIVPEEIQQIEPDNLSIMRDIVFRIREDEAYAKTMYSTCPRLQHLLSKNPDLRPIFEDPKFVRINFEKVYRDHGGVLPEDEDTTPPGFLKRTIDSVNEKIKSLKNHPFFKAFQVLAKVVKVVVLIQKIIGLFSPAKGFAYVKVLKSLVQNQLTRSKGSNSDVGKDVDVNPENLELRELLNAAADHMEDPEIQERMEEMLENPDSMEEAIEKDSYLRAMQSENELCAALMKHPDTMRILVDPGNLRALAETPDLIEKDFADPNGFIAPHDTLPENRAMISTQNNYNIPNSEMTEKTTAPSFEESPEAERNKPTIGSTTHNMAKSCRTLKAESKSWMQNTAGFIGSKGQASLGIDGGGFWT